MIPRHSMIEPVIRMTPQRTWWLATDCTFPFRHFRHLLAGKVWIATPKVHQLGQVSSLPHD